MFYKNIYAFVNKFKDVNFIRDENKFRFIISQCFRNNTFIYHSTKLLNIEKNIYLNMFLQNWFIVLIKKFKKRVSAILHYLQSTKYVLKNAKKYKDFRNFAQNLFKHVKTAELISIYN